MFNTTNKAVAKALLFCLLDADKRITHDLFKELAGKYTLEDMQLIHSFIYNK